MKTRQSKVLIVGAGLAGQMVYDLLSGLKQDLVPVGFVDDDEKKAGSQICGLPILGNRFAIADLVVKYQVDEVIIALPSASPAEISKIIELCSQVNRSVRILPGIHDFVTGRVQPAPIRPVQWEDLLGREPLTLDTGEIMKYLSSQRVLITGAGGSVGTELAFHVANSNPDKLILMGRGENSIYEVEQKMKQSHPQANVISEIADARDRGRMSRLFAKYRPGVVFHTAAHKHVPYMERIPEEAIKNNILGTKVLCDLAQAMGCKKFILISTDKAVKPTSVMGATKRVAEIMMLMMNKQSGTKFAAVRFGNILGSRGSVIPLFEKQIASGGPVTITHPQMTRYFMTVGEAAQLVIQAGAMARGGEIFVLDMGEPICIKELAYKLIKMKGLEPEKDISIKYIGIRPGEKITESLFWEQEKIVPTSHKKIFGIYSPGGDFDQVTRLLAKVEDPSFTYRKEELEQLLRGF